MTLDRTAQNFQEELSNFVRRAKEQSQQMGGDAPLCAIREEGNLVYLQLVPAASKAGAIVTPAQRSDGYAKSRTTLVELEPAPPPDVSGDPPNTSQTLVEDVKKLLRRFRG
ncbi:MAG: hypothetical protein ACKVPX_09965 [Myxococcaceae bacterium]